MIGWRARIGFLVPPGNPTVEPEMTELAPKGVSVHFTRMDASGPAGTHTGQEERNLSQVASVPAASRLLAMLSPNVIVMAHTATSYTIGKAREAELVTQVERETGTRFVTAFGSALAAFAHLGIRRIGYATPYGEDVTLEGKAHFEAHGVEVPRYARLEGVRNIYEETPERAYMAGRQAYVEGVDAVFLSGVGMPTLAALQQLENDIGKPVLSAAGCMMWNALRIAGIHEPRPGYGRLFAGA
ncbi:maleate cis-trans isomerase family protein [Roseixanthobacter liquoris]|uniref:maleate cis-trans isomerase family protein n=1 Tax=Roseixanthobacter liquoris TaxID=3119921 RepID=UPI003726AF0E